MVVSKRDKSRCELHIGDVKIKQEQKWVTDDGKCNKEIQKHIGCFSETKQSFERYKIALRNKGKF